MVSASPAQLSREQKTEVDRQGRGSWRLVSSSPCPLSLVPSAWLRQKEPFVMEESSLLGTRRKRMLFASCGTPAPLCQPHTSSSESPGYSFHLIPEGLTGLRDASSGRSRDQLLAPPRVKKELESWNQGGSQPGVEHQFISLSGKLGQLLTAVGRAVSYGFAGIEVLSNQEIKCENHSLIGLNQPLLQASSTLLPPNYSASSPC
jgi:hypothetical protein